MSSPVVVAFDGSDEACSAVTAAADLFGDRELLIVSVWEPGLMMLNTPYPDSMGVTLPVPDAEDVQAVDDAQRDHATAMANAGVEMARGLGATAAPIALADGIHVADTIVAAAKDRHATAIVVGSRGLSGLKARFVGSTTKRLLHHAHMPVVVVRKEDAE